MKKIIVTFILFLTLIIFFCIKRKSNEISLSVYSWGEFISSGNDGMPDVNRLFTEKTGIKVNYTTFQSNEEMLAKIIGGGATYDVIFPSDYAVSKLIKEDMLAEINFENIPNYKFISSDLRNLDFDPENKYSVPYLWGIMGIFYNNEIVKENIVWDVLWNPKYAKKMSMFDNSRDAFCVALLKNGKSVNSENINDWLDAAKDLQRQKSLIQSYMSDQAFDKLIGREIYLLPFYYGYRIPEVLKDNKYISFEVPQNGTNKFIDCMCILESSKNKLAAEKYINFLCQTDISIFNAKFTGYVPANSEAADELINNSKSLESLEKAQIYTSLSSEISEIENKSWINIKVIGERNLKFDGIVLFFVFLFPILLYFWIFSKNSNKKTSIYPKR
ncbi:MAG: spermidine/putrescine ABC transporter substrate-binding protein [Firmicutes bacterium]|nr:spermidine/putrescine ABC transporter substrate-binding protein [Bacillota bacterium]